MLADLTMAGVNAELRPLVRMTAPEAWAARAIVDWPARRRLFSSWVLLLGVLPIDRHRFYFEAIHPGRGFVERSSSATNTEWRHTRTVVETAGGCRVEDTVTYRCRVAVLGRLLSPVYKLVFRHRHRRLRALYGEVEDGT